MEWDESCETAAARELAEETGLKKVTLKPLGVFSEPGRDPRGTIISVAFWGEVPQSRMKVAGGDDAAEARWFALKDLPELAFDHGKILKEALKRMVSGK